MGKELGLATDGYSTTRSWSGGSRGWQQHFLNAERHNPAGCVFKLPDKPSEVRNSYSFLKINRDHIPHREATLGSPEVYNPSNLKMLLRWGHGFMGMECLWEEGGFLLAKQGTSTKAYTFLHRLFCPSVLQLPNPWGEPLLVPDSFWFLQSPSRNCNVNTARWFSCVEPSKVLAHEWVWFHAALAPDCVLSGNIAMGGEGFLFTQVFMSRGPSLDQVLTGDFWRTRLTCILPTCAGDGGISLQKSVISVCLVSSSPVSCKVQTSARAQQSSNTNCPEKAVFNFKEPFGCQCRACPRWETKPFTQVCQSGLQPGGTESQNSWISVDY